MTLSVNIQYHEALDQLQNAAQDKLARGAGALFVTQCRKKMMQQYLLAIANVAVEIYPDKVGEIRQHYNCSTCARFMSRVGHIVVRGEQGIESLFWNPDVVTDPFFKEVVRQMKLYVEKSRIVTLFNPHGSYAEYKGENTATDGTVYRHFNILPSLMRHKLAIGGEIQFEQFNKQMDRVNTLIRLIKEVPYEALVWVEQMFQSRTIEHLDHSEANLKNFMDLLANLQVMRAMTQYTVADEYTQETMTVNYIWLNAFRLGGLLTLRSSMLGKLLLRAAAITKAGNRTGAQQAGLVSFWKEQTSTLKYQRTTAPSSKSQVERASEFLQANNWLPSLKQREAAEQDMPVVWEAQARWTWIQGEPAVSAQADFADFAARKGVKPVDVKAPITMDVGYFFNEVLPLAESMAVDMTDLTWKPSLFNTMEDLTAKPIFKWDTEEKRAPFIPWTYNQNFRAAQIVSDKSIVQNGRILVPVLSITAASVIGWQGRASKDEAICFLFHGLRMPHAPHPALFAEAIKGELYEYRRAIEDYSKSTQLPRAEGQQALGLYFSARHPQQTGEVNIKVSVRLTAAGEVLYGARDVQFILDGTGYKIAPNVDKYPVITERTPVDAPVTAEEPAPSAPTASLLV